MPTVFCKQCVGFLRQPPPTNKKISCHFIKLPLQPLPLQPLHSTVIEWADYDFVRFEAQ